MKSVKNCTLTPISRGCGCPLQPFAARLVLGKDFAVQLRKLSEKLVKERQRSSRAYRKTPQVAAHSEEQAVRWWVEGLIAAGLVAKNLPELKGSDPCKLALAEPIWKRTTVSQEWIAGKLSMRSAANVSQQLRRFNRAKTQSKLPPEMQAFLTRVPTLGKSGQNHEAFDHGFHGWTRMKRIWMAGF